MLVIPLHAVEHRLWLTQQTIIGASHKSARGLSIPTRPARAAGQMARMWERLAQEAAAPMTSPRPTEAQQPVVQQQQQVQPKDKGGGIIKSPRGRDRQTTEDEFAGAKESGPPKGGPLS